MLSHFYDKANKEVQLCAQTADIDFELSGNELLALLMESSAIKHHYPLFNRAQKRKVQPYGVFSYQDRQGVMHIAYNKLKLAPHAFSVHYSPTACRLFIETLCKDFKLCPKYCHLQENVITCSHFRIGPCEGICRNTEDTADYNLKVTEAISSIKNLKENYIIKEKGRTLEEESFVLIKESTYIGYGFVEKEQTISGIHDLETFMIPQSNTMETEGIIKSYVSKNASKVIWLNEVEND